MSINAAPSAPGRSPEPNVVGVRFGPGLAVGLYLLLLASAGLAMWAQRTPIAPPLITKASPYIFLTFAVGFSAYRLALVMARRYSAFKAFIQIALAAMFFMLLLLPQVTNPARASAMQVGTLLGDGDPKVRALAAEVAGFRRDSEAAPALVRLLGDASPQVREASHEALVRLNDGVDLGPPSESAAVAAWRERYP